MLPGLLEDNGLRLRSLKLNWPWEDKIEPGLRRSDGERFVRKLCDFALRILGK